MEWGGLLFDFIKDNFERGLKLVPEEARKSAIARLQDYNPFHKVEPNHDLVRALRWAWVEAAIEVDKAVRAAVQHAEWRDQGNGVSQFSKGVLQPVLNQIRDRAFARDADQGFQPMDEHLEAVLQSLPDHLRGLNASAAKDHLTQTFLPMLCKLTGWDATEIPNLYRRFATEGLPLLGPETLRLRPFGDLVFDAFGGLLKDPDKYPQARAAFAVAMESISQGLIRECLAQLEGVDVKLDDVIAQLGRIEAKLDALPTTQPNAPSTPPSTASVVQALRSYLHRRAKHWRKPEYGQLNQRFVNLTLMFDRGLKHDGPRHEAVGRYQLLSALLETHADVAAWVLVGAPGAGKSTVLQHHELSTAERALQALDARPPTLDAADPQGEELPEVCIWNRLSEYKALEGLPPDEWLTLPQRWPSDLPPLADLRRVARVRFLLDGLNEIKAPAKATQLKAVEDWAKWAEQEAAQPGRLAPVFSVRTLDQSPMSWPGFEVRQVVLEAWSPEQIEAYCDQQLGPGNALWPAIQADADLLSLSALPFYLWAQCKLFQTLARPARNRAELMAGLFWQMLEQRLNTAPFAPEGLLGYDGRQRVANGEWKHALPGLSEKSGCLVPGLDASLLRLHRDGRQVSLPAEELLASLPALPEGVTPDQWLYAVRSLPLLEAGGADVFTGEALLRCTHQLWQEFFAARGLRHVPTTAPDRLPTLRTELMDLSQTLARLGVQEPLPGPDATHWEEPVKLAVQLVKDPAPWIRWLQTQHLGLAGRAAAACQQRLPAEVLDPLRQALLARSRDADTDLRLRIEAGLALGELGDPRYERRQGPSGTAYLWPRHWAHVPAGRYRLGDDQSDYANEMSEIEVDLPAFGVAFALVTNAEYRCFMQDGGYEDTRWWPGELAQRWLQHGVRNELAIEEWHKTLKELRADPQACLTELGPGLTDQFREFLLAAAQWSDAKTEAWLEGRYGAKTHRWPQGWHNPQFNAPNQPVVGLCAFEAQAYARWLAHQSGQAVHLPTEAQWEAAARGAARRAWPWGHEAPDRWRLNADPAHLRRTSPVGVFPQADSPEGVADLAGNVWEWTTSLYTERLSTQAIALVPLDDLARRVVRGGGWYESFDNCRPSFRFRNAPGNRDDNLGFRVVVSCPIQGAEP